MGERIMWYQRKDHKCVAVLHIIKPIDHHRKFLVSTKSTMVKTRFTDNPPVSVLTRFDYVVIDAVIGVCPRGQGLMAGEKGGVMGSDG